MRRLGSRTVGCALALLLGAACGSGSSGGSLGGGGGGTGSGGGGSGGGAGGGAGGGTGGGGAIGGGGTVGPAGRGAAPAPTGSGAILRVSKSGSDSADCRSAPCASIQRASNLATVRGSVVLVEDGDYAGFCSKHPGVTFFGNGDRVRITSEIPAGLGCFQAGAVGINVEGTDDVVIAGFTVDGMSKWGIRVVISDRVVVRHNVSANNGLASTDSGILTGFAKEVQVLYNDTHGNGEHGIYVSNSDSADDRPVIRGNDTYGNAASGIQINGDCNAKNDGVTDGVIDGAVVDANHVHENDAKGLSMISAPRVTISNNVIENNRVGGTGAAGIHLTNEPGCPEVEGPTMATVGAVVVNNTVVEPRMAAIRATDDASGAIIFNNVLVSLVTNPIVLEEVTGDISSTNIQARSADGLFATGRELAATSPARDAGEASYQGVSAPTGDFAGQARPKGGKLDLGAYESF